MTGFLAGISRRALLVVAGATLASGGAVGFSHSVPDIPRKAGVICHIPDASEFDIEPTVEGGKAEYRLEGGGSYFRLGEKMKFFRVTEKIRDGSINDFCAIELNKVKENTAR